MQPGIKNGPCRQHISGTLTFSKSVIVSETIQTLLQA
jgi:hypothetical protein